MLALMSVGSFVILLVLGPGAPEMEKFFDKALAAFGTLTGAVIGFYFGNRGTASEPVAPPTSAATPATTTGAPAGPTTVAESARSGDSASATTKP